MTDLVPVPWQPECLLTPDTLALLVAASNRAGALLYIDGQDGAWRPWARQAYLYNGYMHGLPGFNTASSPNPPGQRNHMRGAAFDLRRTDAAAQAACRQVGLVRDDTESWHWNNPNWGNMPIIESFPGAVVAADGTYTVVAGGGATLILPPKRKAKTVNFWRDTNGTIFWGNYPIPNMTVYKLLVRYDASTAAAIDTFNPAERDMIRQALRVNGLA